MGYTLRKDIRDELARRKLRRGVITKLVDQVSADSKCSSNSSYNRFAPEKADSEGVSIESFRLFCDAINHLTQWNLPYFQFATIEQFHAVYAACGANHANNERLWDQVQEIHELKKRSPLLPFSFKLHELRDLAEKSPVTDITGESSQVSHITEVAATPVCQLNADSDELVDVQDVNAQVIDSQESSRTVIAGDNTIRPNVALSGTETVPESLNEYGMESKFGRALLFNFTPNKRIAALLTALAIVCITIVVGSRNIKTPEAQAVVTLAISVSEKGTFLSKPIEESSMPLAPGDGLQFKVSSDQPRYLYLLWLDADGKVTPVWPWRKMSWASVLSGNSSESFTFPSGETHFVLQKDAEGIHSVLLLVSKNRLSDFSEFKKRLESLDYNQHGLPAVIEHTLIVLKNGVQAPD